MKRAPTLGVLLIAYFRHTAWRTSLVLWLGLLPTHVVPAQSSNSVYTLTQAFVTTAGGRVSSSDALSGYTMVGTPASGMAGNHTVQLMGTTELLPVDAVGPDTITITVRGTIDDPSALVSVNGVLARVSRDTFVAQGVRLTMGANTVMAVATDPSGNERAASIRVRVVASQPPPAVPTIMGVGSFPAVTREPRLMIQGTKMTSTSIVINDIVRVLPTEETLWSIALMLHEGDNVLRISSTNVSGVASDEALVRVTLDRLPPVVSVHPIAKTNLSPVELRGTVDDSQTTVTINGVPARRTGLAFELALPLETGPNALHLVATSPNGYVTERDIAIERGTVPTIEALEPSDGAKVYASMPRVIRVAATDAQQDPITYQCLLDGTLLGDWSSDASFNWTPSVEALGPHQLTVNVRDDFGGMSSRTLELLVIHAPIQPTSGGEE